MTDYRKARFPSLLEIAESIGSRVEAETGHLSEHQLNWKPDPSRWSVAQCLDHLVTANRGYFPLFEDVLNGTKKTTFVQRLPLLPRLFGRLLIDAVSPSGARKHVAPAIFQPSQSGIDSRIVERFGHQQDKLIELMQSMAVAEAGEVIISSPVSRFIPYSVLDACRIIVGHEERHLEQIERLRALPGFPG